MFPMFIPSKGRPDSKMFAKFPQAMIVVEPQEIEAYKTANPNHKKWMTLEDNNKGIAYVRQSILNLCRELGFEWYWMLDDDIQDFYKTENRKLVNISAEEALTEAEKIITAHDNVGQAALEYAQFAWSQTKKASLYGYCDVCVAINTKLTTFCNYRSEMNMKEDRDFTLQILATGARTLRTSMISFRAPKNGSNKGGLFEEYQANTKERAAVERMVQAWPAVCAAQTKPNGRYDLKINWKFFAPKKPKPKVLAKF